MKLACVKFQLPQIQMCLNNYLLLYQNFHKYILQNKQDTGQKMNLNSIQNSTNSLCGSNYSDFIFLSPTKNQSSPHVMNATNQNLPTSSYLVKIPRLHWQQQKQIYLWRMQGFPNIVGLVDFKIISENANYNNRVLVKIQIESYSNKLSELTELNLVKTIQLMKQALRGVIKLVQRFHIKILDSDNFIIADNGEVKVWLCKELELNQSKGNSVQILSEKNICRKIYDIFLEVALKTKLSERFFSVIEKMEKLQQVYEKVIEFQEQNHLKNLADSKCTNTSTGFSSTSNLKFSQKTTKKKNKLTLQKVQSMPFITTNSFDKNVLSQQIKKNDNPLNLDKLQSHNFTVTHSPKASICCPKNSSTTNWTKATRAKIFSGFSTPNPQIANSRVKNNSLVISQVYQDDSLQKQGFSTIKEQIEQKQKLTEKNSTQNNSCFASGHVLKESWSKCFQFPKVTQKRKYSQSPLQETKLYEIKQHLVQNILTDSKRLSDLQEQTLQSRIIHETEAVNPFQIIINNGWSMDLVDILNVPNAKKSVVLGKQQSLYKRQMGLHKLGRLGRQCTESFLPVEEQQHSFEI